MNARQFFDEIAPRQEPVILKGHAQSWPVVKAANASAPDFARYLKGFYRGERVRVLLGHPAIRGRFFYTEDLQGFNYIEGAERLDLFLDRLLELAGREEKPAISVQGVSIRDILPGLWEENNTGFFGDSVDPKIWLGNRVTVSAHYDGADNLACVIAGRRRFILFPPDQVGNLYPGPLDFTPAGAPVSMVSLHEPDFERYPRYREALRNAYMAELSPGDAVFIPMLWWHHVDSLSEVNGLVNYWWNGSIGNPRQKPTPLESLNFAILAMHSLSPEQRQAWRPMFDHYLFRQGVDPLSYIPEHRHGILGRLSPGLAKQIREWFASLLKQ